MADECPKPVVPSWYGGDLSEEEINQILQEEEDGPRPLPPARPLHHEYPFKKKDGNLGGSDF
jgi:hypothetical protein